MSRHPWEIVWPFPSLSIITLLTNPIYEINFTHKQHSLIFCLFQSVQHLIVLSSLSRILLLFEKSLDWISAESEDKQLKARCDIWDCHSQCSPSTRKQVPGNFLIGQSHWKNDRPWDDYTLWRFGPKIGFCYGTLVLSKEHFHYSLWHLAPWGHWTHPQIQCFAMFYCTTV